MKKFIAGFVAGGILFGAIGAFAEEDPYKNIQVYINGFGDADTRDQPAMVENGRVLVPLRSIFEPLGAKVDWDQGTQTITATKGDIKITLPVGVASASVTGKNIDLDVPAKVVNGHTLVPVRFVSEALGYDVKWDDQMNLVHIGNDEQAKEIKTLNPKPAHYNLDPLQLKDYTQSIYQSAFQGKLPGMDFGIGDSWRDIHNKLGDPVSTQFEEGGLSVVYPQGAYAFGDASGLSDLKDDSKVAMVKIRSIKDTMYDRFMVKRIIGAPSFEGRSEETGKYQLTYNMNSHMLVFEPIDSQGWMVNISLYGGN